MHDTTGLMFWQVKQSISENGPEAGQPLPVEEMQPIQQPDYLRATLPMLEDCPLQFDRLLTMYACPAPFGCRPAPITNLSILYTSLFFTRIEERALGAFFDA